MGLKNRVLQGLNAGLYLSGLTWVYVRTAASGGAVILMYHSVSTPERRPWHDPASTIDSMRFRRQMEFLARSRRVIGFSALVTAVRGGEDLPAGTVAITFDDGYLDNLEVAAPILAEFGLPALLYLCTGYVGRGENQWVDRIHSILRTRRRDELRIPGCDRVISLADRNEARRVPRMLNEIMISAQLGKRNEILASLAEQLRPRDAGPRLTMTWDEVRKLHDLFPGMELGVHTADHCDLRTAEEPVRRKELASCLADFRRELGYDAAHFSFPYGRSDDAGRRLVEEGGLQSAVAAGARTLITGASDPFFLSRIQAPSSMMFLRYFTGGAYPVLPERLFGRS